MCLLLALEAAVAERLEQPGPSATKRARLVRRQAYKNGARRIATLLRRANVTEIETDDAGLRRAVARLAL